MSYPGIGYEPQYSINIPLPDASDGLTAEELAWNSVYFVVVVFSLVSMGVSAYLIVTNPAPLPNSATAAQRTQFEDEKKKRDGLKKGFFIAQAVVGFIAGLLLVRSLWFVIGESESNFNLYRVQSSRVLTFFTFLLALVAILFAGVVAFDKQT